ncbi:lipopolysaccharide kinase InaA family protein [bacterium]|nr:lipopolysaccharide kinase InaA family protein [bacterium]
MIVPAEENSLLAMPKPMRTMDAGRLHVHPDFLHLFESRGWMTAASILNATDVEVFRRLPDRENARVRFASPHASASPHGTSSRGECVAYLKRHQPSGAPLGRGPGFDEAEASRWCEEAGVRTPTVIAFGHDDLGREFFLGQNLSGYEPSDDWLKRNEQQRCSMDRMTALLTSLGRTIGKLHSAGLFHRDLYWCHLFVREERTASFDVRLIDLQRIHRPHRRRWRWRLKDLGQFVFSFPPGWASPGDLRTWFAAYLGKEKLSRSDMLLLEMVRWRARFYAWREKHRRSA